MRKIREAVLGCMALAMMTPLVAGADDKLEDVIVGTWETVVKTKAGNREVELKIRQEFTTDGKLKMTYSTGPSGGSTFTGTYKVIGGQTLTATIAYPGVKTPKTTKFEVKATQDELALTSDGKTSKYTRVKVE